MYPVRVVFLACLLLGAAACGGTDDCDSDAACGVLGARRGESGGTGGTGGAQGGTGGGTGGVGGAEGGTGGGTGGVGGAQGGTGGAEGGTGGAEGGTGGGTGGVGGAQGGTGGAQGTHAACTALCSQLASGCGSMIPQNTEVTCLDECETWTALTLGCVENAVGSCDFAAMSGCFPGEPLCEAACTNLYYGCGYFYWDLDDPNLVAARDECVWFCENDVPYQEASCLAAATCGDIPLCPTKSATCAEACGNVMACGLSLSHPSGQLPGGDCETACAGSGYTSAEIGCFATISCEALRAYPHVCFDYR